MEWKIVLFNIVVYKLQFFKRFLSENGFICIIFAKNAEVVVKRIFTAILKNIKKNIKKNGICVESISMKKP